MRILSGSVELRAFDDSLSETVHAVRNHPSVRANMRDPRPITRESHEHWVRENLVQARRLQLFVVLRKTDPAGIALLRNFRGGEAEIGLMIVEPQRRRLVAYVAAHLIAYYGFEVLGLDRLLSYVPLHNDRALEFNRSCGFAPTGERSDVYHVLSLSKSQSREHATHKRFRQTRGIRVES